MLGVKIVKNSAVDELWNRSCSRAYQDWNVCWKCLFGFAELVEDVNRGPLLYDVTAMLRYISILDARGRLRLFVLRIMLFVWRAL